jgi:hypothetical protein
MQKNPIALALSLSVGLHIALPLAETIAQRYKRNVEPFDHIVSWPAWLCSAILPEGHGALQLVLPLVFSLAFYAGAFWLMLILYGRLRRAETRGQTERFLIL